MTLGRFAGVNAGYVLELYERFRQNPESVDPATRAAFEKWNPAELEPVRWSSPGSAAHPPTFTRSSPRRFFQIRSVATDTSLRSSIRSGSPPIGDPSLSPRHTGSPTRI